MSISPTLLVLAILANLAVVRLNGILLPDSLYFSFSAFLFDNRDLDRPLALAAKLAMPFLVAFAAIAAIHALRNARQKATGHPGPFDRLLEEQANATLVAAAFATAFLLAWPYILLWDLLIDPEYHRYRLLYTLAYMAYFIGYGYFALAGANTARALMARQETRAALTLGTLIDQPFIRPLANAATGSLTTALATFLATRVGAQ